MIPEKPYILYSLPKSRTTQSLLGRKGDMTCPFLREFLLTYTDANFYQPNRITLVAYTADEDSGEKPEPAEQLLAWARKSFGDGITGPVAYQYPGGSASQQSKTEWQLAVDDFEKALHFMQSIYPQPKYNMGPVELIISYDFKLKDHAKAELPDQQHLSYFLLWISRTNNICPNLYFPFSQPNTAFWQYLESIEQQLPFKLERKYLRLVQANKSSTRNVYSKL